MSRNNINATDPTSNSRMNMPAALISGNPGIVPNGVGGGFIQQTLSNGSIITFYDESNQSIA